LSKFSGIWQTIPQHFSFHLLLFCHFFCHIVILISIFSALLIADTKIDLILADFSEKIVTFGKLSLTNTNNSKHYTIDTNQYLLKLVQHLIGLYRTSFFDLVFT